MKRPNLFQNALAKIYETYSKDVGKSLIHMGAVGWVFSAFAQVGALAFNKKIDKKEKNFLFPQEIADGVINVGLYYTVCQGIKSLADKCIDTGKLIPEKVYIALQKLNNNKGLFTPQQQKQIFHSKNITKTLETVTDSNFIKNLAPSVQKFISNDLKPAAANLAEWKNGIGTIATIGASVLACNIITPYARNVVASKIQSRYKEEHPSIYTYRATGRICSFAQSKTFNKFKI